MADDLFNGSKSVGKTTDERSKDFKPTDRKDVQRKGVNKEEK